MGTPRPATFRDTTIDETAFVEVLSGGPWNEFEVINAGDQDLQLSFDEETSPAAEWTVPASGSSPFVRVTTFKRVFAKFVAAPTGSPQVIINVS
ncbi:MAG: hypothetical protein V3W06_04350 [Acidimicrobiia bacterium]